MINDLSQYRDLYITTAKELIATMKTYWENLKKDSHDMKALEELHRAAHSLKSQSLVMGYPQLGLLNKELEAFFKLCRENKITITSDLMDTIQRAITSNGYSLDKIEKEQTEPDINTQIHEIEQLVQIST